MATFLRKDPPSRIALSTCLLAALPMAGAESIAIPMAAHRWRTEENAKFLRQPGFDHGPMREPDIV